jgi:hypothetical protein
MSVFTLHHGRARRAVNGLPAPRIRVARFPSVTSRPVRAALFPRADKPRKETAMNDPDTTISNYERHRQAQAQLSEGNKNALFDVLAAANITQVRVEFDGEGDSGQITSVSAFRNEERLDLASTPVSIQQVSWGNTEPVTTQQDLHGTIETLCYDFLEETHGGWENNDGAFGEFHFDVATRIIELEFIGRFTDTFTSSTRFEGGEHGTSLSSLPIQRAEMGRHNRRLPAHP